MGRRLRVFVTRVAGWGACGVEVHGCAAEGGLQPPQGQRRHALASLPSLQAIQTLRRSDTQTLRHSDARHTDAQTLRRSDIRLKKNEIIITSAVGYHKRDGGITTATWHSRRCMGRSLDHPVYTPMAYGTTGVRRASSLPSRGSSAGAVYAGTDRQTDRDLR